VPVPDGRPVTSPEDAWEAAQDLEGPVVVKPRDANHGRGVALNLTTREEVVAAYEAALKEGDEGVLVERFAPGFDHRLLVVGNTLVAAARREPPSVIGDGEATIAALIDRANADPLRGDGFITPLKVIPLDDDAVALLAEHGYTPDSIPPAGVRVPVGRKINFFNGGLAIDVTERVHPEVAARAVEAARVVGLDVAGLDVVALDVARPLEEQGGDVVEVNAGPGLQMHLFPSASPRPVGEAIIEHMYPDGEDGQVPIVAVTGALGATLNARLIAHILRADGRRVGLACSEGIEFEGRRIKAGDCSGAQGARTLLLNPLLEAAVCETSAQGILTGGLGFDQCHVAVILDPGDGPDRQESQELGAVERVVAESVKRWGGTVVLNADDPRASSVVNSGSIPLTFFSRDADNPLVVQSRAGGGTAVVVRHGSIVVASRESEEPVIDLHRLPMVGQDGDGFRIEDALAGVAAAFALNASREAIRVGLETFVAPSVGSKSTLKETSA
jgi:cyanophycin synthetase